MQYHAVVAAEERLSLCASDADRTAAARAVARAGGADLLLYCVADDHAHTLIRGEPGRVGQIAGNIAQALQRTCRVSLQPTYFKLVDSRSYLKSLLPYILDQTSHHVLATAEHPAIWPGSAFLDLVGARLQPGFRPDALREALPRLARAEVWNAVKLDPVEPADDALLASIGLDALVAACTGALGLRDLDTRSREAARARRAIVRLAGSLGFSPGAVRERLRTPARTARRHASAPSDEELDGAIRWWVAIHAAARAAPPLGRAADRRFTPRAVV